MQTWQGLKALDGGERFLSTGTSEDGESKNRGAQRAAVANVLAVSVVVQSGAIMRGAGDLALLGLGGEGHGGDDLILLAMRRWCLGERRDGRQVGAGGNFHFLGGRVLM